MAPWLMAFLLRSGPMFDGEVDGFAAVDSLPSSSATKIASATLLISRAGDECVLRAIGRELLGFIWAIGIQVETAQKESLGRAA